MGSQFEDEVLEGDGFRLSPLDSGDVEDVTSACRDETTQRWLPLPTPYTSGIVTVRVSEIAEKHARADPAVAGRRSRDEMSAQA